MSSNITVLNNKAEFDKAIETKGKYVLIYVHTGAIHEKAEEYATKSISNCATYSVNAAEEPKVKDYFGISETPAVILYKDGQQVKKAEGADTTGRGEIFKLIV